MSLATFNDLPVADAELLLRSCFAHPGWALQVASRRPYADLSDVMTAADEAWAALDRSDWLRAFAAHPRIGEAGGHAPEASRHEQSGMAQASSETTAALASENRRYEEKFGHVFLIAAEGRRADEMLSELRRRMTNDPAAEVDIAAREQRKITRRRLERVLA